MKKYIGILLLFSSACGAVKPYYGAGPMEGSLPSEKPEHTIYLIGDAGDLPKDDPIISSARSFLETYEPGAGTLIFLGDNLYHFGLPPGDAEDRNEKEQILRNQMDIGRDMPVDTYFIPGNHDWDDAGENGFAAVRRQEAFVEQYLDRGNTFLPDGGCPGPVAIDINENLMLILIDSQWWLHQYEKPGKDGCTSSTREEFAEKLYELVRQNADRDILLAGHHPVLSNGEHGGHFGIMDHLFPLVNLNEYLYIPLPVIGSIYPIARSSGISRQDIPNKDFATLAEVIEKAFENHNRMLYASGHDHNLQYISDGYVRQIVSGSGSKVKYVSRGRGAEFTYQERGFVRVLYYEDRQIWIEFIVVGPNSHNGEVVYRRQLY